MKFTRTAIAITGATLIFSLAAATASLSAKGNTKNKGYNRGSLTENVSSMAMQELSIEEKNGLLLMREEEKLARDVYNTLYEKWQIPIFANIAASEQRHMDAVKALLNKYDLQDPIKHDQMGIFADTKMAKLYKDLVNQGLQSLQGALMVGAIIEDLDIKDLNELLQTTDNLDIQTVYQNLAKGSRNHLRSFTAQLEGHGVKYNARYLSQPEVDSIINTEKERGRVDNHGKRVLSGKGNRMGGSKGKQNGPGYKNRTNNRADCYKNGGHNSGNGTRKYGNRKGNNGCFKNNTVRGNCNCRKS